MEYQQAAPRDNKKRIVIGGSVAVVFIGVMVFIILLRRNAALEEEQIVPDQIVDGTEDASAGDPTDATSTDGPASPGPFLVPTPPGNVPAEAVTNPDPPKYAAGLDRKLTSEEKTEYGFKESDDVWIKTEAVAGQKEPAVYIYEKNPKPAPDADRDGVPDDFEAQLGTDPNKADSDGDGKSDWEYLESLEGAH
jgi:hypothetical protein